MNTTQQEMIQIINQRPEGEMLRLFSALGATQIVYSEGLVQFKVKGDKGVNKVVVKYTQVDLFDVEFYNIRGMKVKLVDTVKGLYNDMVTMAIWRGVVIV